MKNSAKHADGLKQLHKRLLREGEHLRLDSLLELSASYQALVHKTPQHEEAVRAFIDKRPPPWQRPQ